MSRNGGRPPVLRRLLRAWEQVPSAVWWALLVLYSALLYHVSSRALPRRAELEVPGVDKVEHALAYGLWASLCLAALSRSLERTSYRTRAVVAASLASLYGLSDEIHQAFVPERDASMGDFLADAAGAVAAVILWGLVRRAARKGAPRGE